MAFLSIHFNLCIWTLMNTTTEYMESGSKTDWSRWFLQRTCYVSLVAQTLLTVATRACSVIVHRLGVPWDIVGTPQHSRNLTVRHWHKWVEACTAAPSSPRGMSSPSGLTMRASSAWRSASRCVAPSWAESAAPPALGYLKQDAV
jgi:hypothetical protein